MKRIQLKYLIIFKIGSLKYEPTNVFGIGKNAQYS